MVFGEVTNKKKEIGYFFNLKQRIHRVVDRSQEPSELYRNGEYNLVHAFCFLELVYYLCFSDKKKLDTGRRKGIHP